MDNLTLRSKEAPVSSWVGSGGDAGLDLRSDTMTGPTSEMLEAIRGCSLLDDVFMEDPTTTDLESHVATLAGKEAGLLVVSGTMGNQLALRTLLSQPPFGVLCDHRSHIIKYEAGGVSSLTGAMTFPIIPENGFHLTLEDIKKHAVLDNDVHSCPTRVISLENTLNGLIMPLEEVKRISTFAHEHGIKVHCDGARLWEAVASGAGSLGDFCACFDTVSLCFSKGLGAPIGSILLGDTGTIKHARWVRKSIGGGLRQSGVIAAPARIAVDVTFGQGPNGEGGLLTESHKVAKEIAALWTGIGGRLTYPVQTNMCWLNLESVGCSRKEFVRLGQDAGLKLLSGRLVIHYQVASNKDHVLERLGRVFKSAVKSGTLHGPVSEGEGPTSQYH